MQSYRPILFGSESSKLAYKIKYCTHFAISYKSVKWKIYETPDL